MSHGNSPVLKQNDSDTGDKGEGWIQETMRQQKLWWLIRLEAGETKDREEFRLEPADDNDDEGGQGDRQESDRREAK